MTAYTAGVPSRSPRSVAAPRVLQDSDVFVGFLCLYLLTAGRTPPLGDAIPMWQAAQSLVGHGGFAIPTRWPLNAPVGVGGSYYPVAALLACLVHVPGALLQRALTHFAPGRAAQFVVVTAQLGPIFLGAAVPTLFFRLLKRMGYQRRQAAWTTLLLGAGTSVWVYAHRPYSEILQIACFLAFFAALWNAAESPTRTAGLRFGLTCALLLNAKNVYVVCLPGAMICLYWRWRERPRVEWRAAAVATMVGLLPGLLALAAYNALRWGAVTSSGYGSVTTGFWNEDILVGLWGQFLSPGKSIFLYAPPLLLSLRGLPLFWRRRRATAIAVALVVGPVVLVYARYLFWSGDWGWGPRYLVFALPLFLLPAAELFTGRSPAPGLGTTTHPQANTDAPPALPALPRSRARRWLAKATLAAVISAGVGVQCLGNAFYWNDFINIARQAQQGWLGRADARGTVLAPYPCFSCFEEVYGIEWLPPFQPIVGHWWLLRHKLANHDWKTAESDAPWKRYTSITVDIEESYQAAGIDWWPFAADPGKRWPGVLFAVLLLLAIPKRRWRRALFQDA